MTHDDELIERVLSTLVEKTDALRVLDASPEITWSTLARAAVDAVRAYDAERRASVLDAAAAALVGRFDPDDYRDLPVAMTGPTQFKGGLTTEKRK